MYVVVFCGKRATWYPTFSSEKRAWDYIIDEIRDETKDFDRTISLYKVVRA